jgi:hypothetical protein
MIKVVQKLGYLLRLCPLIKAMMPKFGLKAVALPSATTNALPIFNVAFMTV